MAESNSRSRSASGLLKVVFLAHLVLSSWGMESPYLVPTGYLYYNLIFMISLIWAVASDNIDSASMAFLVNIACIIMDSFSLAFWPRGGASRERVYFGLAIANSVLRAVTAILLYRLFKDRDTEGAGLNGVFGDITGVFNAEAMGLGGRKGYQPIDDPQGQGASSQSEPSSEEQRGGGNARGTAPQSFGVQFANESDATVISRDFNV